MPTFYARIFPPTDLDPEGRGEPLTPEEAAEAAGVLLADGTITYPVSTPPYSVVVPIEAVAGDGADFFEGTEAARYDTDDGNGNPFHLERIRLTSPTPTMPEAFIVQYDAPSEIGLIWGTGASELSFRHDHPSAGASSVYFYSGSTDSPFLYVSALRIWRSAAAAVPNFWTSRVNTH